MIKNAPCVATDSALVLHRLTLTHVHHCEHGSWSALLSSQRFSASPWPNPTSYGFDPQPDGSAVLVDLDNPMEARPDVPVVLHQSVVGLFSRHQPHRHRSPRFLPALELQPDEHVKLWVCLKPHLPVKARSVRSCTDKFALRVAPKLGLVGVYQSSNLSHCPLGQPQPTSWVRRSCRALTLLQRRTTRISIASPAC